MRSYARLRPRFRRLRLPRAWAAPAPAPAPAPKSSTQFTLTEVRRLSPCENHGMHNIFVKVVDAAGNPVDGVTLVQTPNGQPGNVLDKQVSGSKGPGKAEFIMWKMAEYSVYVSGDGVNPGNTEIAQPLHSNFTDEAECGDWRWRRQHLVPQLLQRDLPQELLNRRSHIQRPRVKLGAFFR